MACRTIKSGDEINQHVHGLVGRQLEIAEKHLKQAVKERDAAVAQHVKWDKARVAKAGKPTVVCFEDSNQGYGKTYGYVRVWAGLDRIKPLDETGKWAHQGTTVNGFMIALLDLGIWCECLGEFGTCDQSFDVKICGSIGAY